MSETEPTDKSAENSNQFEATDTVRETIRSIDDVNEATKRVNSILNQIRNRNEEADVQIVVANLGDA